MRVTDRVWWTIIVLCVVLALVFTAKSFGRTPPSEQRWQYRWQIWLPDKWRRIGICETGLNWRHSNSSYQGAFGFAIQSWDAFAPARYPDEAWQATPWQQYQVALRIYRRYGLSGWGCRNA